MSYRFGLRISRRTSRHPSRLARLLSIALVASLLAGCGMHRLPADHEAVQAAWQKLTHAYRQRAQLVSAMEAVAPTDTANEKDELASVAEAYRQVRAVAADIHGPDDPRIGDYFNAETQLTSALAAMLSASQQYSGYAVPQAFVSLRSRLDRLAQRIAHARRAYNNAVDVYDHELTTVSGRFWHTLRYRHMHAYDNFGASALSAAQTSQLQF